MPALKTQDAFLDFLHRSGVVSDDAMTQLYNRTDLPAEPRPLAKQLIAEGVLTHFQAEQLLQGRWRNFLFVEKYHVLERIGKGATGQVYLCEHLTMRRLVAIKVLPKTYLDNPAVLERFYREGRIAASLEHPNIVRSLDNGRSGKHHYLVMEYIHGNTFQRIVDKVGVFDIYRAAQYIHQAATGLTHIHQAKLVHRDIKPSNLLLDQTGTVKILDLGLARNSDDPYDNITSRYEPSAILGTADFLSPEQARSSSQVDIRSDIYSLGVTWYFLLVGASPYAEVKSVNAKLMMHQLHDPEPLHNIRGDVPKEMSDIITKMLEKDPDDRFQSPTELVEALKPWTSVPVLPPDAEELPNVCPALERRIFPHRRGQSHSKVSQRPKIERKTELPRAVSQDTIPTQMDTAKSMPRRAPEKPKLPAKPRLEDMVPFSKQFVEAEETREVISRKTPTKKSRPKPKSSQPPRRKQTSSAKDRIEVTQPRRKRVATERTNPRPSRRGVGITILWIAGLVLLATTAGLLTRSYYAASEQTQATPTSKPIESVATDGEKE